MLTLFQNCKKKIAVGISACLLMLWASSFSLKEINSLSVWLGRQKDTFSISWQYWSSHIPVVCTTGLGRGWMSWEMEENMYYELVWDALDSPVQRELRSVRPHQLQTSGSAPSHLKIITACCHSAAWGWLWPGAVCGSSRPVISRLYAKFVSSLELYLCLN